MAKARGSDGQEVHYRVVGDSGYPVVLLQGLGLAGDFWVDVPERLAALASGPYRVYVLDNRGVGASVGRAISRLRQLQLSHASP